MARVLIRNLNKFYDDVHAVKDVNLEIRDKEFMVFVGSLRQRTPTSWWWSYGARGGPSAAASTSRSSATRRARAG